LFWDVPFLPLNCVLAFFDYPWKERLFILHVIRVSELPNIMTDDFFWGVSQQLLKKRI